MRREDAIPFIAYAVDDALSPRRLDEVPANACLVGWQCGFEPMFVAVWSYLPGCTVDPEEADEIARDYLEEIGWFASYEGGPPDASAPADFVIGGYKVMYLNHYTHEDCPVEPGVSWDDEWDCTCNDRCPACNAEIEPHSSEELEEEHG